MELLIFPTPENVIINDGEFVFTENTEIKFAESNSLKSGAYKLCIDNDITVTYGDESGRLNGYNTLMQLKRNYDGKIPACVIEDEPKYSYRGFMLDCARHSFTLDEIKKIIDELALLKFNYFHWHLTDDQGWRIESEKHPELISTGSKRKASWFDDGKEYSAYFTKAEMKEIASYCNERGISVIPEFDVPGHTSALIASMPQLSCHKNQVEVKTNRGIFKDVLCVGSDVVYETVIDLIDEITDIFNPEYMHIGGDEVPKDNWQGCPVCQKAIKDNNLKDEKDLQTWFMKRVADYVNSKGIKPIVWNESIKGEGLGKDDVIVQRWIGNPEKTVDFANNGGKYIESDFFNYYFDYPYGFTPLKKTCKYKPLIKGVKNKNSLFGVEAPLWTEFVKDFDRACYLIFPRLIAISETGWNGEIKDYKAFCKMAELYCKKQSDIKSAPAKDWDPSLAGRAGETVKFFMPFLTHLKD